MIGALAGLLFNGVVLGGAGCLPAGGEQVAAVVGLPQQPRAPTERATGPTPQAERSALESPRLASRLLATLPVRERGPKAGYAREQYGPSWFDADRNGCDTRNDILRRDLSDARLEAGRRHCVVEAGRLKDLYTGAEIVFERGRGSTLDIDHVVALADAWVTGAAEWEPDRRIALANDPLNLLAVDASANRAKGDKDAGRWLPQNTSGRCEYVARQIAVKVKYSLWVTADEQEAMRRVLIDCPDRLVPTSEALTPAPIQAPIQAQAQAPREARRAPAAKAPAAKIGLADPDYGTCKQAKAHGAGPYYRDRDPEYAYYRDGDGDGIVCE